MDSPGKLSTQGTQQPPPPPPPPNTTQYLLGATVRKPAEIT